MPDRTADPETIYQCRRRENFFRPWCEARQRCRYRVRMITEVHRQQRVHGWAPGVRGSGEQIVPRLAGRVLTAHVPLSTAEQVDHTAARLERSRSGIVKQAIAALLARHAVRERMACGVDRSDRGLHRRPPGAAGMDGRLRHSSSVASDQCLGTKLEWIDLAIADLTRLYRSSRATADAVAAATLAHKPT